MSEVTEKTKKEAAATTTTTVPVETKKRAPGLTFRRFFTKPGENPYDV